MSQRVLSPNSSPAGNGSDLAQRFWATTRAPRRGDSPETTVEHLLAILKRFRATERSGDRDKTIAGLSLVTLLSQHEACGDLCYASPEQLEGKSLGQVSEVFSVAVLLFERLCEKHPFGMGSRQLLRVRKGELGSSVNFLPRLPVSLRAILTKALSVSPDERYSSLGELEAALEIFVAEARQRPRLPGTGPVPVIKDDFLCIDAVQPRKVSEWERLSTDAGADELAAPAVDRQMRSGDDFSEELETTVRHSDSRTVRRVTSHSAVLSRGRLARGTGAPKSDAAANEVLVSQSRVDTRMDTVEREAPETLVPEGLGRAPTGPVAVDENLPRASRGRQSAKVLGIAVPMMALAAAIVLFVQSSSRSSTPATSEQPSEATQLAAAALPSEAAVAPSAEPVKEVEVAPAIEASLEPAAFSPEAIARDALSLAAPCFDNLELYRAESFGFSILFEPGALPAHKVFFPAQGQEITEAQRRCVDNSVIAIRAEAPPDRATAVELRMTLAPIGHSISVTGLTQ